MADTVVRSEDLTPGTRLRWLGTPVWGRPQIVTLERRKLESDDHHGLPFHPGWWIKGGGGLADYVIDREHSQWEVLGA